MSCEGPKFLNVYDNTQLKDIKTYKDIKRETHLGPLEINYKYKISDYYEKTSENAPTTAPKSSKRRLNSQKGKKLVIKNGERREMGIKTSHGLRKNVDVPPALQHFNYRSNSAGAYIHSSSSPQNRDTLVGKIRPSTQGHQFPEDFCIENTLNQYPFQFQAKYGSMETLNSLKRNPDVETSESEGQMHEPPTTEMILHIKGPIYSTAERNSSSSNAVMQQFMKRAYFTNADSEQFFRKPVQEYPSLKMVNPSILSSRREYGKQFDYTAKSTIRKIKRVVATSQGNRMKEL
uniref:Uncharacterized protein n=1 Tax=Euplotes harpa TaxID=151035 RepID=A0A7S3NCT5_9SPIT|mmetsp:Transcript_37779/g.43422  ORF Transcript_37779/g.43422 Transcript_37779/m.43422 type:complete len:290 (+) Transcript_37779:258-1127(+)